MPLPQKATAVRQKTARERVYDEVKEWIITGTLLPGERIYDQEIAAYFSVSRTPVREAIQLLSDQGLINIYPGSGTIVSEININEINKIYRIAAELHSLALEFAFEKITDDAIRELDRLNEAFHLAQERGDNQHAEELDRQFHRIFVDLSDNKHLTEFINTLESHIRRVQLMENPDYNIVGKKDDSYHQHAEIIEALKRKDLNGAKEAMRTNWLHTIEVAEKAAHRDE